MSPLLVSSAWVRLMARYNAWQNDNLFTIAETLDETERQQDRGAFFGSIHHTLAHILWGDRAWMARLAGWTPPAEDLAGSPQHGGDWPKLAAARRAFDADLIRWSLALSEAELTGDLHWYSRAAGRDMITPRGLALAHMFNHQTHHRGQVHAMITAAGGRPGPTDLPFMPADC